MSAPPGVILPYGATRSRLDSAPCLHHCYANSRKLTEEPSKFRTRRIIQNHLIADYDAISVILRQRMSHGLQTDTP
jgi:hypothetical protein